MKQQLLLGSMIFILHHISKTFLGSSTHPSGKSQDVNHDRFLYLTGLLKQNPSTGINKYSYISDLTVMETCVKFTTLVVIPREVKKRWCEAADFF